MLLIPSKVCFKIERDTVFIFLKVRFDHFRNFKMGLFVLFLCLLIIATNVHSLQINGYDFKIYPDRKSSEIPKDMTSARSATECAVQCSNKHGCSSANYMQKEKRCEMLERQASDLSSLPRDPDWVHIGMNTSFIISIDI